MYENVQLCVVLERVSLQITLHLLEIPPDSTKVLRYSLFMFVVGFHVARRNAEYAIKLPEAGKINSENHTIGGLVAR